MCMAELKIFRGSQRMLFSHRREKRKRGTILIWLLLPSASVSGHHKRLATCLPLPPHFLPVLASRSVLTALECSLSHRVVFGLLPLSSCNFFYRKSFSHIFLLLNLLLHVKFHWRYKFIVEAHQTTPARSRPGKRLLQTVAKTPRADFCPPLCLTIADACHPPCNGALEEGNPLPPVRIPSSLHSTRHKGRHLVHRRWVKGCQAPGKVWFQAS